MLEIERIIKVFITGSVIVSLTRGAFGGLVEEDLNFEREWVQSIEKLDAAEESAVFSLFTLENMCAIAKKKFSLPYIDEDKEPSVNQYRLVYGDGREAIETAMDCVTVPYVYLRPGESVNRIIATSVTLVGLFEIDIDYDRPYTPKSIELVRVVNEGTQDYLSRFSKESRQKFCAEVRKALPFLFIGNYVLMPHAYEFVYENKIEIDFAIPCPTYPPTFIRAKSFEKLIFTCETPNRQIELVKNIRKKGESQSEAELEADLASSRKSMRTRHIKKGREIEVLNRKLLSSLNEEDRRRFCKQAYNHIHYAIPTPQTFPEASSFELDYGNGLIREQFAISCTENYMLLYFDNALNERSLMKIVILTSKVSEL